MKRELHVEQCYDMDIYLTFEKEKRKKTQVT